MFDKMIPPAKLRQMADTLGVDTQTAGEILGAVAMKKLLEDMGEGTMRVTLAPAEAPAGERDPAWDWDLREIEAEIRAEWPKWKLRIVHAGGDGLRDTHLIEAAHPTGRVTSASSPEALRANIAGIEEKWTKEARDRDAKRKREARSKKSTHTLAATEVRGTPPASDMSEAARPAGATSSATDVKPSDRAGGAPSSDLSDELVTDLDGEGFAPCPATDASITPAQIENALGNYRRASKSGDEGAMERAAAFLARAGWKSPTTLPTRA